MDSEKLRRFVALTRQIADLNQRLGPLEREREALQLQLQDEFARDGIQNVRVDGYTVYVSRDIWAKYPSRSDAIEALKASGHDEYVYLDINHQSVSALVRSYVKGEGGEEELGDASDGSKQLPEEWEGKLGFTETFKVKAKRS